MEQNRPAEDNGLYSGFSNALSVIEEIRHPLWKGRLITLFTKGPALVPNLGRSADECNPHLPTLIKTNFKSFFPTIFSFVCAFRSSH